ncbi:MAG: thiamine phosphate synthase [Dysosmobacter welbionis]
MAAAVDGRAGIVQLREKHMGQADFLAEAERFVALCREKGAVSIINDNVEIAAQTGADGVHVGQEDLEAGRARELLGPDKLIGVSAHSVEEALAAQAAGADYLGVGAARHRHQDGRQAHLPGDHPGHHSGGGHPGGGHRRHQP